MNVRFVIQLIDLQSAEAAFVVFHDLISREVDLSYVALHQVIW